MSVFIGRLRVLFHIVFLIFVRVSQCLAYKQSSLEQSICTQVTELGAVALVFTVDLCPSRLCAVPV